MQVAGHGRTVYFLREIVPYVLDLFENQIYGDVRIFHKDLGDSSLGGLYYPWSRRIHINNRTSSFLLKVRTLLHECTHANQHFRGDLTYSGENIVYQNILYSNEFYLYNYRKIPFEEEAFHNQEVLFPKLAKNIVDKNPELARDIKRFHNETYR